MCSQPPDGVSDRANPQWWEDRYRRGDIPWDSGVTPPEVVSLIRSGRVQPGRALDIGCGTGVTSRFLAAHGFQVVGIDFSHAALDRALRAARDAALPCVFARGNAADIRFARVDAAFAVDIGCFHSLSPAGRRSYIQALAERMRPGAHYLLYTFLSVDGPSQAGDASAMSSETPTVSYADIAAFAPYFALRWTAHGEDRARHSAWFLMQRV